MPKTDDLPEVKKDNTSPLERRSRAISSPEAVVLKNSGPSLKDSGPSLKDSGPSLKDSGSSLKDSDKVDVTEEDDKS